MALSEKMRSAFQRRFGYSLRDAKSFLASNHTVVQKDHSLSILGRGNITLDVPQRTMAEIDTENVDLIQRISRKF